MQSIQTPRVERFGPAADTTTHARLGAGAVVQVVGGAQPGIVISFQDPSVARSDDEYGFTTTRDGDTYSMHGEEIWIVWPVGVKEGEGNELVLRVWPFPSLHTGTPREWYGLEETLIVGEAKALSATGSGGPNDYDLCAEQAAQVEPRVYNYATLYLRGIPKLSGAELQLWVDCEGTSFAMQLWDTNRALGVPIQTSTVSAGTVSFQIPPAPWKLVLSNNNGVATTVSYLLFLHQQPPHLDSRTVG